MRGGGSGECGSLAPPRPAQPPAAPPPPPTEWFAPSALFNPRDCSSAGSLPVPASAPGSEVARGRPVGQRRRPPAAQPPPPGTQARQRVAGCRPGRAMGGPSALPLLLLLACCGAPGGANLSQDGEFGGGAVLGGGNGAGAPIAAGRGSLWALSGSGGSSRCRCCTRVGLPGHPCRCGSGVCRLCTCCTPGCLRVHRAR